MFGLDWSELALIAAVALVVIGPKDLPGVLRTAGQWAARARAMARDFQRSLEEIAQEADLGDVQASAQRLLKFDIAGEVKRHLDPDGTIAKGLEPPPELLEPLIPPAGVNSGTNRAGGTFAALPDEEALAAPAEISAETAARASEILIALGLAAPGPEPVLPERVPLAEASLAALGLAAHRREISTLAPSAEATFLETTVLETTVLETMSAEAGAAPASEPAALQPPASEPPASESALPEPTSPEPALAAAAPLERAEVRERAAGA